MFFGGQDCNKNGIYKIPAGQALIITGVTFFNGAITANVHNDLDLEVGPASAPCAHFVAGDIAPPSNGGSSQNQVFNPGIPVPAGDAVGMAGFNETGSAEVCGYLVPKADVPSGAVNLTPARR